MRHLVGNIEDDGGREGGREGGVVLCLWLRWLLLGGAGGVDEDGRGGRQFDQGLREGGEGGKEGGRREGCDHQLLQKMR